MTAPGSSDGAAAGPAPADGAPEVRGGTARWARWLPGASLSPALRLVERNVRVWQGLWLVLVSVGLEPLLYLLSIGVGVGALVGDVALPDGTTVPYRTFVATGLLAASAMFGPVFDSTFNFFAKLKYFHTYDAVLATPLRPVDVIVGELGWSLIRGALYASGFLAAMVVLGLVGSWWAVLALPAALLIGFAFAGAGLAAATLMRSFIDFDLVALAIMPMFLFSATFFPLSQYPEGIRWLVQVTPLYQGVVLERALVLGQASWALLVPVAYLLVMGALGLRFGTARLVRRLQP